jgi:hypothetical protein
MKKLFSALALLMAAQANYAATLIVEGKYQNKNVFVQNFYGGSGVGYCALEVKVNGRITTDEVNSNAFEIDLASLKLKYGEKVTIEIQHKNDCTPRVLNMDDLRPRPTFEVLTMNITSAGILKWTSKNESGALPYIVEQFKWNKWVPIGEVDGAGTPETHEYSFKVTAHSGANKYRVKQIGFGAEPKYSNHVVFNSSANKPNFALNKENTAVEFSSETCYEIYDNYGMIVKKGFGSKVEIANLEKGKYYLCYDNQVSEIDKKKSKI